jgi:hypothetical protein
MKAWVSRSHVCRVPETMMTQHVCSVPETMMTQHCIRQWVWRSQETLLNTDTLLTPSCDLSVFLHTHEGSYQYDLECFRRTTVIRCNQKLLSSGQFTTSRVMKYMESLKVASLCILESHVCVLSIAAGG